MKRKPTFRANGGGWLTGMLLSAGIHYAGVALFEVAKVQNSTVIEALAG